MATMPGLMQLIRMLSFCGCVSRGVAGMTLVRTSFKTGAVLRTKALIYASLVS